MSLQIRKYLGFWIVESASSHALLLLPEAEIVIVSLETEYKNNPNIYYQQKDNLSKISALVLVK